MTDEAADLLTRLVAIRSPSGKEAAAAEHLVQWLAAHGLAASVDEAGNAVGVKGVGRQEILLLGHIDTFRGELPVRRDGDLLYGRGTVDAKGPLCAFAAALAQVDVPQGWRVTLVGAVEEESATSRGARAVVSQRARGPGPPCCCVIGEPIGWDSVTIVYKGRLVVDITLRAPYAHSAGREPLPAERAIELWRAIQESCSAFNEEAGAEKAFDRLDASLRSVQTEDHGAFGQVHLGLALRLPPGLSPGNVKARLVQTVRRATVGQDTDEARPAGSEPVESTVTLRHGSVEVMLAASAPEPAYKGPKAGRLVRSFLAAIRGRGGAPRFVLKTGTCDMNVLGANWPGVPMVAYGPGDSSLDHTPEEHIDVREFLKSTRVMAAALAQLMAG